MKFLIWLPLLFFSCGTETRVVEEKPPSGNQPPIPDTGNGDKNELNFTNVNREILQPYCAPCHAADTFMQNEAKLFGSNAMVRILPPGKSMPPGYASKPMPDNVRNVLIQYLQSK